MTRGMLDASSNFMIGHPSLGFEGGTGGGSHSQ